MNATVEFFNLHMGNSPCTGVLQLMSRSKGQHTYLVSSLQMTLRKACSVTESFSCLLRGSNPWPLALKASVLTTRLPCFLSTFRWNAIFQHFSTIQDILMNSLGLKNDYVLCTFLFLFILTTLLLNWTTVHRVCVNNFNYTFMQSMWAKYHWKGHYWLVNAQHRQQ